MPYYSGANGDLQVGGTSIARVQKWAFSTTVALLDTTALGDTDAMSTYGVRNTAGSCSLFYWQDGQAQGDCSRLIRNIVQGRTNVATQGVATAPQHTSLRLRLNDGSTNGRFIRGEVLLTAATMTMAQGDVFSADVTFQFLGAPVEATL